MNKMKGVKISNLQIIGKGTEQALQVDNDLKINNKLVCRVFAMTSPKRKVIEGHYHNGEVHFNILKGKALFELINVDTKEKVEHELKKGQAMVIAPRIAHKVTLKPNTFITSYTLSPSFGKKIQEKPYKI